MPSLQAPSAATGTQTGVPQQTLGPPELLWAASWWGKYPPAYDLYAFPEQSERKSRKTYLDYNVTSLAFQSAVRRASRLWILDSNFDVEFGFRPLHTFLQQSYIKDLRINTGMVSHKMEIEAHRLEILDFLSRNARKGTEPLVEVKYNATTGPAGRGEIEPHDRFAIVDQELWHFGHTVGGGQRSVNAFSHGWSADTTGAVTYFEELWGYA